MNLKNVYWEVSRVKFNVANDVFWKKLNFQKNVIYLWRYGKLNIKLIISSSI